MRSFVSNWARLSNYLSLDFLAGPRLLRLSWVINFQKGATGLWVLFLMTYYQNDSTQAWVYLALHGSYGVCWLMKDAVFPDPKWQTRITFGGALMSVALVLGPYWVIPYVLISPILGESHIGANGLWMTVAIVIHTLGIAVMMTADAQKYFTLKYHPKLITTGMFKHIRHPNYLGEMMIYGAYALVAWHWVPWLILAWVWIGLFAVNIAMKEREMAKLEGWQSYKAKSYFLIPGVL